MDSMKIRTPLTKAFLGKILSSLIRNKLGYDVKVHLGDVDVTLLGENNTSISASVELKMNNNEFKKLLSGINL